MKNTTDYELVRAIQRLLKTAGLRGSDPDVSFRQHQEPDFVTVTCSYTQPAEDRRIGWSRVFSSASVVEIGRLERTVQKDNLRSMLDEVAKLAPEKAWLAADKLTKAREYAEKNALDDYMDCLRTPEGTVVDA